MAKKVSQLEIFGSGNKRSITATFVISLDGTFVPMQLINDGKTQRSGPKVQFPYLFSLSANPKYYSNTAESIKITNEILVPYFKCQRKSLELDENFPALLILDDFHDQMTNEVTELLTEKNILFVKVPNNMTHLL